MIDILLNHLIDSVFRLIAFVLLSGKIGCVWSMYNIVFESNIEIGFCVVSVMLCVCDDRDKAR